ncbi:CLUMA_CG005416, isoform A [Clunio marinus]|uniref:CLUMA_CG005416, isoform A n=1 Tax=Clunio marinus TaxID=568069 RepID=A0A1J1I076_9DIPT|nr:CLUMA_CG005416, isoform A [Clunio marinus]
MRNFEVFMKLMLQGLFLIPENIQQNATTLLQNFKLMSRKFMKTVRHVHREQHFSAMKTCFDKKTKEIWINQEIEEKKP